MQLHNVYVHVCTSITTFMAMAICLFYALLWSSYKVTNINQRVHHLQYASSQTKHRMHANETPNARKRNTERTQTKAQKRKFWKSSTNNSVTANAKSHKRARKLSLNDVNLAVASTVHNKGDYKPVSHKNENKNDY